VFAGVLVALIKRELVYGRCFICFPLTRTAQLTIRMLLSSACTGNVHQRQSVTEPFSWEHVNVALSVRVTLNYSESEV